MFNMQVQLQLGEVTKASSASVAVLGVWFDPRLRWAEHVKVMQKEK